MKKNSESFFIQRFYFTPLSFIISLFSIFSFFILFLPLELFNYDFNFIITPLLLFISINFILFFTFPYIFLRKDFNQLNEQIGAKQIGLFSKNKFSLIFFINICLSIGILVISDVILQLFLRIFFNFYLVLLGFVVGLFLGLTASSKFLERILKNQNPKHRVILISSEEYFLFLTKEPFPLFKTIEIKRNGEIEEHTIERVVLFLFYNSLLWFQIFMLSSTASDFSFTDNLFHLLLNYYPIETISYFIFRDFYRIYISLHGILHFTYKLIFFIGFFAILGFIICILTIKLIKYKNFDWLKEYIEKHIKEEI